MAYQLLLSKETLNKILQYKQNIEKGLAKPGKFFLEEISKQEKSISEMDITTFTQLLIQSKKPQVFAESQVYHDGSDWTLVEESILGDISVNMPVTMYNDGGHGSSFKITQSQFPVIWRMCQAPSWLRAVDRLQI